MSRVSVIIPTYNTEKYIKEAVESVLAQTYSDIEIIIVDDGSTDNTQEVLKPLLSKVKYIYQENKGLAGARNTGIKAATGKYIQFLDSDDLIEEDKITKQVDYFSSHRNYSICYCNSIRFQNSISNKESYRHIDTGEIKNSLREFIDIEGYFPLPVHTVLIKREVFDDIGVFNESLGANEDREFWVRTALAGYEYGYQPFYGAYYRKHGKSMTDNYEHMVQGHIDFANAVDQLLKQDSRLYQKFSYLIGDIYFAIYKKLLVYKVSDHHDYVKSKIKERMTLKSKYFGRKDRVKALFLGLERSIDQKLKFGINRK